LDARAKECERAKGKLLACDDKDATRDMMSVITMCKRDSVLMSQKISNMRYFDKVDAGEELNLQHVNKVLGNGAKIVCDASKQLVVAQWTVKDLQKKARKTE
jgi:hypothetical protein